MKIGSSKNILEAVEGEQKLFHVATLFCRNPQCQNYDTEVDKVKNELQLSKE